LEKRMAEYVEITRIGDVRREFMEKPTGKIVLCKCPQPHCQPDADFLRRGRVEARVKDCPIHGWA
jgi:hypothetical protein